jgi:uncharacterized membrane protein YfcA
MFLLLLGIGLAAGVLSGLFGIGGGVLIVAALVVAAKWPILQATGTSLAALLLPVGLLGALEYHRRGHVDFRRRDSLRLGCSWAPGSARGSPCTQPATLQRLFAVFLVVMAIRMWFGADAGRPARRSDHRQQADQSARAIIRLIEAHGRT